MWQPRLSELPFASLWVYSPKGSSETSRFSQKLAREWVKEGRPHPEKGNIFDYAARLTAEHPDLSELRAFLLRSAVLVPVPRSSLRRDGDFWPSFEIARSLIKRGLGARVEELLERTVAVKKSATAAKGERTTVEGHVRSLQAKPMLSQPNSIVLVDDVVTKGRTLLAAANVLHHAYPQSSICAFALVRTRGFVPEIDHIQDLVIGSIVWKNGDAQRNP